MEYFTPALFEVLRCKVLLSLLILLKAGENITQEKKHGIQLMFSNYEMD